MSDTDAMREDVRKAVQELDSKAYPGSQTHARWQTIRTELLRLANENADYGKRALEQYRRGVYWMDRAKDAESGLSALKERIFQGILLDVHDLALGHAGLPSEWRGKRVRLVVEE